MGTEKEKDAPKTIPVTMRLSLDVVETVKGLAAELGLNEAQVIAKSVMAVKEARDKLDSGADEVVLKKGGSWFSGN